jgi:hypothetical protein
LDISNSLRGKGTLAKLEGYRIMSDSSPELNSNTLYVLGEDKERTGEVSRTYSSFAERNAALLAFITMVNQINGKPLDSDIPPFLGGTASAMPDPLGLCEAADEVINAENINIGGKENMFTAKSNTLTNVLGGSLVIDMAGFKADDVKVIMNKDKDSVRILVPDKDDATKVKLDSTFALAKGADIDNISYKVEDGVFTLDVSYKYDIIKPTVSAQ